MAITAAQLLASDIRIVDRTPLQITNTAAGVGALTSISSLANIGALAGISVGGVSVGGVSTGGVSTGGATGGGGTGPAIVIAGAGDEGGDAVAFDPMLDEVRPGDLITSDFMMRLLARLNRLEAVARTLSASGDVLVPDLFGQSLSATITAVQGSDGLLTVGRIFDTAGQQVSASEPGTRVVLGQHPAPGAEVDRGTRLNLLVSFVASAGQQPATGGGTGTTGSTGTGPIRGGVGINEAAITGAEIGRAVTPGSVTLGTATTVPGITSPTGPRPEEIEIRTTRPDLITQPGVVSGVTQPAVSQPAVSQPAVTQPAVTQPGTTVIGTASVPVVERAGGEISLATGGTTAAGIAGGVARTGTTAGGTSLTSGGAVGGLTDAVARDVTGSVTTGVTGVTAGGVTGATLGGVSGANIGAIAGGILSEEAAGSEEAPRGEETPRSEEAPRSEETPRPASKGAPKRRRSPKK